MTTVLFPDQHWCRQYGTPCSNANIWNECRLTACNRVRTYPPVPVVEIKREESNMTNREWLESLSDEMLASKISERCGLCANQDVVDCGDCVCNITTWLAQEYEPPKKEFTQDQLNKVFRDKFMERRAIGILEIEELIGELFR